ncbi:hypothetical protein [Azospirillum himalayense]|uniref:Uncharacterized protein n=1 Tax=Azospirillum himalayense TaxID=654847 RepID=A0ABW0G6P6_9PROT
MIEAMCISIREMQSAFLTLGPGCAGLPTWFLWARNRPFDCDRPRLNRSKKPQHFQGDAFVFQRWGSFKSNDAFYKNAATAQSGSAAVPRRAAAMAFFKLSEEGCKAGL